ncbi:MAG: L-histidine N(alpha)-methyltransferase [Pseudomonadota bacterium]
MTDSDAQAARKAADLEEVLAGLALPQKRLSPKYFYDERGSKLFEAITEQPEYYPTRTEIGILEANIQAIGDALGTGVSLIEFGAGASVKVRILLDHVPGIGVFVPVDISGDHLQAAADTLALAYPNIEVLPVTADFTRPFQLPSPRVMPDRNIVFFPGSTIGNFPPEAAQELLTTMRRTAGDGGGLLIGVDLKKDANVLERAYNDKAGVTAAFNCNMLHHLNGRLGTNFRPEAFKHRAIYNEDEGRIEMHLVSQCRQSVNLAGQQFEFAPDEYLLTECSYKFSLEDFAALADAAGFTVDTVWQDAAGLFSVQNCRTKY